MTKKPKESYEARLNVLAKELKQLQRNKRILTWKRLFSFLGAVAAIWILSAYSWILAIAGGIILISLFVYFVYKDLANSNSIENYLLLISINKKEQAALNYQFLGFPDGAEWKPALHNYANDLDIFGRASLYQYANRSTSEQGNKLFADWLLSPANVGVIKERQDSVKELAPQIEWRQQLQAFGINNQLKLKTEKNILDWLNEESKFIKNKFWVILRIVFPILSFTVLGLYIADVISFDRFLPIILGFLFISYWVSKQIMPDYIRLNKITGELETLSSSISCIENKDFTSPLLLTLKMDFNSTETKASSTIKNLKKILDRLDYRLNPIIFIPLSALVCWDLQQIFALENWKQKNKTITATWFSSLANFEALSSIANLSFNHPDWSFPEIVNDDAVFIGEEIGHPLIPKEKRVTSSFSTNGLNQISLVTGSNMAGKSTFLRSVGVNIVLAMMGSPVCAKHISVSHLKVMSSMRISDNLEESTSTFYAELKKLKEIIDAVYANEKAFLLLDEILRGTNSADRHTGSSALLKQLIKHNAAGIVATHDLELAKLSEDFPSNIHNYHFDVKVNNEELYFDYKLNKGICRSMNASILMKKIGIEL
ncbi:MAG: hypothetical protein IPI78_04365 [Chitinophagaceae bacterium]|nr:hypothetical protein [Chitinophagaceae bacterium]